MEVLVQKTARPARTVFDATTAGEEPAVVTKLSSDEWISTVHLACANDPVGVDPTTFVGWLRPFSVCGLMAFDAACNIPRIERTQRHARLDGVEDYSAIFQLTGGSNRS
jgi:hypothetical protein